MIEPKQRASPPDIAEFLIAANHDWPAKHGDFVRQNFGSVPGTPLNDVFREIIYFLNFSTDLAFYLILKDKPDLEKALRNAFTIHLRHFILEHGCMPLPYGEWLGDTRIWMTTGETPIDSGTPLSNLDKRFSLYSEALRRGKDKYPGESLAYVLTALCGTSDIAMIAYFAEVFSGKLEGIRFVLDSFEVTL